MKKFSLGLESAEFQNDNTFFEIANLIEEIIATSWKEVGPLKALDAYVSKRFGLKTMTTIDEDLPTCTSPDIINDNNTMFYQRMGQMTTRLQEWYDVERRLEEINAFNRENYISVKEAKVSGFFSDLKVQINLNKKQLKFLSSREIAAVYLHEVGHTFSMYDLATKMTTTNYVMLELCGMAEGSKVIEDKKIILKKCEEVMNVKPGTLDAVKEAKNSTEAVVIYMNAIVRDIKSSTGSSFYDLTTWEQMADQFVSRLGGGRYLIQGLDILHLRFGDKLIKPRSILMDIIFILTNSPFIKINIQMLRAIFGLKPDEAMTALISLTMMVVKFCMYVFTMAFLKGTAMKNFTYDEDKVRLKRIRNDYMHNLKLTKDDKHKKYLLREIELCDKVIAEYTDYVPIFTRLGNFLFKAHADAHAIYTLHRDLEELAFNDLFIKSEKLRLV